MILSSLILVFIDYRLNTILEHYIDSEVDKMNSEIIHYALEKMNQKEKKEYLTIQRKGDMIQNVSYNTLSINQFKEEFVQVIEEEFYAIENGDFQHYSFAYQDKYQKKYPYFQNGYLCEVNLNSLKSTLFGNIGPSIPIKLSYLGSVQSDFQLQVKEYGINNVILEVDVYVMISNLITMPISSRKHDTKTKNVLSIELIQGEIPNYYGGVLS